MLIAARVHLFPFRTQKLSSHAPTILGGRLPGKIGNANTKESGEILTLFLCYYGNRWTGPPVSCWGARRMSSVTAHLRPSPTPATRSGRLTPPQAALPSLPIPNTEVKLACADNSSKHKIQCSIFRKRKTPSVSWLFLSPQRLFAFAGTPFF